MALALVSDLIAAPKQYSPYVKTAIVNVQAIGAWAAGWLNTGVPAAGVAPSSGVAGNTLTSATVGAIPFVNPASGLTYVVQFAIYHQVLAGGVIYLYDRLWHNSGLSATLTTSQTVNSVTLPSRCPVASDPTGKTFDALGTSVEAWWEVYVAMGAGTVAPTISYTDEAGNAGATATAQGWVTAAAVGRCFPFDLAAGDRGVRSIQSYQQTATQTSGTFGLVLRRRIAAFPIPQLGSAPALDWSALGAPVVPNDACLEVLYCPSSSGALLTVGYLTLAQG